MDKLLHMKENWSSILSKCGAYALIRAFAPLGYSPTFRGPTEPYIALGDWLGILNIYNALSQNDVARAYEIFKTTFHSCIDIYEGALSSLELRIQDI